MGRGRPKAGNDEVLLKYTQVFKQDDGSTTTWIWDKTIHPHGPISVEHQEFVSAEMKSLIKEKEEIEKRYERVPGERKKRITKEDKLRLEELNGKIEKI